MNTKKLPVLTIFREAVALPGKHYLLLLKVGFPLILTTFIFITYHYLSTDRSENTEVIFDPILFLFAPLFLLTLVMAIIGCHRIFLLGHDAVAKTSLFNWTGNELKYAGWWILIGLIALLIALPFTFILFPLFSSYLTAPGSSSILIVSIVTLLNIPMYYLISRWSLVLPSSAIDIHGKSIRWSWGLSKNNGWRLTALVAGLPLIMDVVFEVLPNYDSLIYSLATVCLWLVVGVIQIGLLSLSYAFLVNENNTLTPTTNVSVE